MDISMLYRNGLFRKIAKRILTCNIGRVEEFDDKLICYVKNNKLYNKLKHNKNILILRGIDESNRISAERLNLNKKNSICVR